MFQLAHKDVSKYFISDIVTAYISWLLFFIIRKTQVEHIPFDIEQFAQDSNFFLAGFVVALYWSIIYTMTNTYQSVYTKSRLAEVTKTILQSIIGCLILSVFVVLDDIVESYRDYYYLMDKMILTHLIPTLALRLIWLSVAKRDIKSGKVTFPTLLIGSHKNLNKIFQDITQLRYTQGLDIISIYSNLQDLHTPAPSNSLQLNQISEQLKNSSATFAILALSKEEREDLPQYISTLDERGFLIKIIPELNESLTSQIKINNPIGATLIDIDTHVMSPAQATFKRAFDLVVSISALIILSPVFLIVSILIRKSSSGPIFYSQERIGQYGQAFTIYKFRSMHMNAEDTGPQLSSTNDNRTTPIGQWIRKYRVDEIPQFFNVLKGDMSIVGPRPERKFYADQIIQRHPEYKYIYKLQPGITSWGMVRFGYASNVEEMIERMQYDMMYVHNYSILMDFRIIIYTIKTIISGKGV
ncbi:MAG TPA: sugar transferase [Chitinophagales bacterium]|nr:sugar transferase [Chitinophagales bacterium]